MALAIPSSEDAMLSFDSRMSIARPSIDPGLLSSIEAFPFPRKRKLLERSRIASAIISFLSDIFSPLFDLLIYAHNVQSKWTTAFSWGWIENGKFRGSAWLLCYLLNLEVFMDKHIVATLMVFVLVIGFCLGASFMMLYIPGSTDDVRTTQKDIEFSRGFCRGHDGPQHIRRNKYGLQITCGDDFRVDNLRPFVE